MSAEYFELTNPVACARADFSSLEPNAAWGGSTERELKLHRIHAYPAKFPAFITTKALEFARSERVDVETIADVFCGCGTVAFEARRNGIHFWGCDINPVATLIACVKSSSYQSKRLDRYYREIVKSFDQRSRSKLDLPDSAVKRLNYWYSTWRIQRLARLRDAIYQVTPSGSHYQQFFLCAFSNILKPTSRWLTKSIKPQIDPEKRPPRILTAFKKQVFIMLEAIQETKLRGGLSPDIRTASVFDVQRPEFELDMILTSPPYVTSYEYADLHQLSSLWLGFTSDYRDLRRGSIGSAQYQIDFNKESKQLNTVGTRVVFSLFAKDRAIAKSTARYFLDMQAVSRKCFELLRKRGIAVFVIGNTEYKGTHIENAAHLAESLLSAGFSRIRVAKRRMSGKILTPYRNRLGRFTRSSTGRHIYGEEFVLIANRP